MEWIMGNQSRPQEGDGMGGMSKKGMQVGKDGRVKGRPGLMEQQHSSTSGSQEGGEDGEMDREREDASRWVIEGERLTVLPTQGDKHSLY